jgi:hypothetical protein
MNTRSVPVFATVLTLGLTPTAALAGSGDVAATQAYIRANYGLVHAARAKQAASEAALQSVLSGVRRECPRAAAESPQNHDSEQLSNEVVLTMRIAGTRPETPAIAAFTRAVKGLHWSKRKLTNAIQSYVSELKALSTAPTPNLCADIRAWVASGYRTRSPSTMKLDQEFETLNVALGELAAPLLAPYERPGERAILSRTIQFELQIADFEANAGVETWGQIMDSLGLSP